MCIVYACLLKFYFVYDYLIPGYVCTFLAVVSTVEPLNELAGSTATGLIIDTAKNS